MAKLTPLEKQKILECTTQIVASVSQNEKITWNIQSLEELTEKLYKKMAELVSDDEKPATK